VCLTSTVSLRLGNIPPVQLRYGDRPSCLSGALDDQSVKPVGSVVDDASCASHPRGVRLESGLRGSVKRTPQVFAAPKNVETM
jgi:hypothetical protein